jgi:hypothetical protein
MADLLTSLTMEHMIFVFALVFVFLFRGPLSGLINRTEKIGKDGLTASSTSDAQIGASESTSESVQKLLDVVGNSIVINDQEKRIIADLEAKNLDASGDSIRVLVKHLAGTQLLLAFEQIHGTIFGSQIKLLKKLNELVGEGRPSEFIENHFRDVQENFPELPKEWDLEKYLEFMFSHLLIVKNENQYHITNIGVEYLTWVARNGKPEDKYL